MPPWASLPARGQPSAGAEAGTPLELCPLEGKELSVGPEETGAGALQTREWKQLGQQQGTPVTAVVDEAEVQADRGEGKGLRLCRMAQSGRGRRGGQGVVGNILRRPFVDFNTLSSPCQQAPGPACQETA